MAYNRGARTTSLVGMCALVAGLGVATAAPSSAEQPTSPDRSVVVDHDSQSDEPTFAAGTTEPFSVPQATPNDPYYPIQWGLPKADVLPAWDRTLGAANVVVANLDTGYDFTGPELKPAAAGPGRDFVGANADAPAEDGNATDTDLITGGHGLHTAGIIAAQRDNRVGVAGLAPGVRILPVRVCGHSPSREASICPQSSQVAGVHYAAAQGARVVNLPLSATMPLPGLKIAIAAYPQTLFVVAAGNSGASSPSYPCAYDDLPNVLCVTASDQGDGRPAFANHGSWVDLAAPGNRIVSTYRGQLKPVSDTFQQPNFPAHWAGNGFMRAPAGDGPLTTYGMSDSPGAPVTPNRTSVVTWRPVSPVPSTAGRCRVEGRRFVDVNGDPFWYRVVLDGVEKERFSVADTAGSGMESFVSEEFDAAGSNVALRIRYEAGPTPGAGVWLDDLAVVCVAPATSAAGYAYKSGTSMAASHVSAAAALLLSLSPGSSADDVRSTILDTVRRLPSWSGLVATGGLLDTAAALGRLVPPDTVITSGPRATTPNRVTFTFQRESPAAATYRCRLDDAPYRSCKSGRLVKGIPVGSHTFSVYAVDTWGNVDATPATYAWTVVRCTVPKLRGLKGTKLGKAERRLNDAGCRLGKVIKPKGVALKKLRVKATLPARGSNRPSGTKVRVVLVQKRR